MTHAHFFIFLFVLVVYIYFIFHIYKIHKGKMSLEFVVCNNYESLFKKYIFTKPSDNVKKTYFNAADACLRSPFICFLLHFIDKLFLLLMHRAFTSSKSKRVC